MIQTPTDTMQTPPRHRRFYVLAGIWIKSIIWVSWPNIFFCQQIWYWCLPRHPQTPSRHPPDTLRHHPDTPRHRPFYAIEGTGRKGNIQVWPISNFANGFGIATSRDLLSPQTHSRHQADTPRHNPDTPSYRIFMQYRSLEEKTISEFHDLL